MSVFLKQSRYVFLGNYIPIRTNKFKNFNENKKIITTEIKALKRKKLSRLANQYDKSLKEIKNSLQISISINSIDEAMKDLQEARDIYEREAIKINAL